MASLIAILALFACFLDVCKLSKEADGILLLTLISHLIL